MKVSRSPSAAYVWRKLYFDPQGADGEAIRAYWSLMNDFLYYKSLILIKLLYMIPPFEFVLNFVFNVLWKVSKFNHNPYWYGFHKQKHNIYKHILNDSNKIYIQLQWKMLKCRRIELFRSSSRLDSDFLLNLSPPEHQI